MLFRRSLTSASGKLRSTRASSVTSPLREKYPTPLLNRTTRVTGSDTAGLTSCFASPGAAPAPRSLSAPKPAAIPSTPAAGATSSHFIDMAEPPQGSPDVGREWSGVRPRLTPIIPDPLPGATRPPALVTPSTRLGRRVPIPCPAAGVPLPESLSAEKAERGGGIPESRPHVRGCWVVDLVLGEE